MLSITSMVTVTESMLQQASSAMKVTMVIPIGYSPEASPEFILAANGELFVMLTFGSQSMALATRLTKRSQLVLSLTMVTSVTPVITGGSKSLTLMI